MVELHGKLARHPHGFRSRVLEVDNESPLKERR